jgi:hypothetical protein
VLIGASGMEGHLSTSTQILNGIPTGTSYNMTAEKALKVIKNSERAKRDFLQII